MEEDRVLREIAARQHHLVTRSDVTAAGLSPNRWQRRVQQHEWIEIVSDVFRHRLTPETWQLRARAGLLCLGHESALFGATATAWWGLEIPDPRDVEFLVPRGRRSLDNGLIVHTTEFWDPCDLTRRNGARVTTVPRTIIDLAASGASAKLIETVIDSAIRLQRTTFDILSARLSELGEGRRGVRLLRALMLDSGGESHLERRFLKLLRKHKIRRPKCQVVHRDAVTGRVRRVDFEYPDAMMVVEVSGRLGHVSDQDRKKDARRRNALQRQGLLVLEFVTSDILDEADYVVTTIREELARRSHVENTLSVL